MGKQTEDSAESSPLSPNIKPKILKRDHSHLRGFNPDDHILGRPTPFPSFDFASQDAFKHRESQHRESNFTTNCSRLSEIFDSKKKQNSRCDFANFLEIEKINAVVSSKKIVNLSQIELTPNNQQTIGGITFSMKASNGKSPSPVSLKPSFPKKSHMKGFRMKKLNTFCDDASNCTLKKFRKNSPVSSPYITAYRKRLFKIKSESGGDSEVSLVPPPPLVPQQQDTCCNCRTSQCLKLYCECFKSLGLCGPRCRCTVCQNDCESGPARRKALERILSSKYGKARFHSIHPQVNASECPVDSHTANSVSILKIEGSGCHCRKSNCVNKYCGCHSQGQKCGVSCNCQACYNN